MTSYLFIYGTLLSGIGHPMHTVMLRYTSLVGKAHINGKLYEVSGYPGLVLSSNSKKRVQGEIYRIEQETELFAYLDRYEGCDVRASRPHEYRRSIVTVHDAQENGMLAWSYLYKRPVDHLQLIPSGDYLAFRNEAA